MVETKMYCPCCGKEFFSKYYQGGYIDHVVNFSNHRKSYAKDEPSYAAFRLSRDILFSGNNIYPLNEIETRLNCVMYWDCISDDVKKKVREIVIRTMAKIKDANNEVIDILDSISPMALAIIKDDDLNDCYKDAFDESVEESGIHMLEG